MLHNRKYLANHLDLRLISRQPRITHVTAGYCALLFPSSLNPGRSQGHHRQNCSQKFTANSVFFPQRPLKSSAHSRTQVKNSIEARKARERMTLISPTFIMSQFYPATPASRIMQGCLSDFDQPSLCPRGPVRHSWNLHLVHYRRNVQGVNCGAWRDEGCRGRSEARRHTISCPIEYRYHHRQKRLSVPFIPYPLLIRESPY